MLRASATEARSAEDYFRFLSLIEVEIGNAYHGSWLSSLPGLQFSAEEPRPIAGET